MRIREIAMPLAMLCTAAVVSGCVPAAVIGGGAVVHGVTQERDTADILADTDIGMTINTQLLATSATLARRVAVDVKEGRVVLSGGVEDVADSVKAAEIAWATPGVVSVTNEIIPDQQASASRYANDVWISSQVRGRLITNGTIRSQNYTVDTHDGVVHLTGIARSPAELSAATSEAASVVGVRQVVSHVLSIDDPRRVPPGGRPDPVSPNSEPARPRSGESIDVAPLGAPS